MQDRAAIAACQDGLTGLLQAACTRTDSREQLTTILWHHGKHLSPGWNNDKVLTHSEEVLPILLDTAKKKQAFEATAYRQTKRLGWHPHHPKDIQQNAA